MKTLALSRRIHTINALLCSSYAFLALAGCGHRAGGAGRRPQGSRFGEPQVQTSEKLPYTPLCPAADKLRPWQLFFTPQSSGFFDQVGCTSKGLLQALNAGPEGTDFVSAERDESFALPAPSRGQFLNLRRDSTGLERFVLDDERPRIEFLGPRLELDRTIALEGPKLELTTLDQTDFIEICYSRNPILINQDAAYRVSAFSVHRSVFDGNIYFLVNTCGYVDLHAYSSDGKSLWSREIWNRPRERKYFIGVPTQALINIDSKSGNVTILVEDSELDHPGEPARGNRLQLRVFDPHGALVAENEIDPKPRRIGLLNQLQACGESKYLIGTQAHDVSGAENRTHDDDVWVARISGETLAFDKEVVVDNKNDDLPWAIECNDKFIFVGGQTDKFHVDTGSWFGGSRAFLLRFTHDLRLEETLTFGGARLNAVHNIFLGKDSLVVSGSWDGTPSNHSPDGERWWRSFVGSLPQTGWQSTSFAEHEIQFISEIRAQ